MWRLIFLGLLIWLIIHFLKRYLHGQSIDRQARAEVPEPAVVMVKCEACGVHLPSGDALMHENKYYCSQAHLPKKTS